MEQGDIEDWNQGHRPASRRTLVGILLIFLFVACAFVFEALYGAGLFASVPMQIWIFSILLPISIWLVVVTWGAYQKDLYDIDTAVRSRFMESDTKPVVKVRSYSVSQGDKKENA